MQKLLVAASLISFVALGFMAFPMLARHAAEQWAFLWGIPGLLFITFIGTSLAACRKIS